ncbi:hypothetical protein [Variovorax sp. YR566]|uniref:hypothetical protein n=1 Tax=Variovorax sp. YR566 TaxID=3450237 RepID=UPI003F7D6689
MVRRVRSDGPQHVIVHGRDEVLVIAAEEFRLCRVSRQAKPWWTRCKPRHIANRFGSCPPLKPPPFGMFSCDRLVARYQYPVRVVARST